MDRLDAMATFIAVADLKGFAPAARRLGLSPSAVTRLVAGLEERLQTRLLQRTTRSVTLTDAGVRYLERARRILADVDEAEAAASAEQTNPKGRFVVAAPRMFGRLQVAPVMSTFLKRHPQVMGELWLSDAFVNLVDESVDVAVRIGQLADSTMSARKVGATRRVLVAAPKYLTRRKALRSPDDLPSHQLIQFTGLSRTPEWRFFRDSRPEVYSFAPVFKTDSADVAIIHAERGGGLTMALFYQVAEAVKAGHLKVVLADFEPPPLPIQLVYPTARLLPAKVTAFVDLIRDTCNWQFV
ncbi:MAG: LysR family transcriptional regulator [Polyangiaceae bacterium]|nr:LysR family transcriptional regulator [Polyangiaceae bacterium]